MARKSRKEIQIGVPSADNKLFNTAIYARLSIKNNKQVTEKNVIENQVELCKQCVDKNQDLLLSQVYIDDGYTGTNFKRPEFQRLLMDIKLGKIDCLVVKDLSRLGRDYIEVGTYIERLFPRLNIRFISIKEGIDSYHEDIDKKALIMSFQNVINQSYSKDISKKVSVAHQQRMKTGEHIKGAPPYGYQLSVDKRSFILDEEQCKVVQQIFNWKLEGVSYAQMLRNLDKANIPTPKDVQKSRGGEGTLGGKRSKWHRSSLYNILRNPTYMGDIVLGRTEDAKYKGQNKRVYRSLIECRVLKNMHMPIVTREEFYSVQDMIEIEREKYHFKLVNNQEVRKNLVNIFSGKIYCDDCGSKMYFHRKNGVGSYECSKYEKPLSNECSSHNISMDRITLVLKNSISNHINLLMEEELARKTLEMKYSLELQKLLNTKKVVEKKLERKGNDKLELYERLLSGSITQDQYLSSKGLLEESVGVEEKNLKIINRNIKKNYLHIEKLHNKRKLNLTGYNTNIVNDLELNQWIEYVSVDKNKNLNICLRYQSIFECAG